MGEGFESEFTQQRRNFRHCAFKVQIMSYPGPKPAVQPWLADIGFPGMNIGYCGLQFVLIDPSYGCFYETFRQDPQVSPSAYRDVEPEQGECGRRKLMQTSTLRPDYVRKPVCARKSVPVVVYGEDARIITKPLLCQHFQSPKCFLDYRIAGSPETQYRASGNIFQDAFRQADIFPELFRSHIIDQSVPVAVTGYLMPRGLDLPD